MSEIEQVIAELQKPLSNIADEIHLLKLETRKIHEEIHIFIELARKLP